MENKYHKTLTPEKWQGFSKEDQILNIAAEFSRAKNGLIDNDEKQVLNCLDRAFELLDLTINDSRWRRGLNELLRLRDVLAQFYISKYKSVDEFKKIFQTLLMFTKFTSIVKI
ncbi:MAG: hypothetical protein KAS87_03005 [Candidatus Omnitrophica bacterium]|nr:hypothetical protein [Candidatus Omnitrophota bacterium]